MIDQREAEWMKSENPGWEGHSQEGQEQEDSEGHDGSDGQVEARGPPVYDQVEDESEC